MTASVTSHFKKRFGIILQRLQHKARQLRRGECFVCDNDLAICSHKSFETSTHSDPAE